jgi:hypothetical protein
MKAGESAAEKVMESPIIEPQSVSADGKWVAAQVAMSGKDTRRAWSPIPCAAERAP